MKVNTAFLADAATIREGLLHVLGAPITRLWRAQDDRTLRVQLVILLELGLADYGVPHQVQANLNGPSIAMGKGITVFTATKPPRLEPGETLILPQVIDLHAGEWYELGRHQVEIQLDDAPAEYVFEFYVLHPEEAMLPPLDT